MNNLKTRFLLTYIFIGFTFIIIYQSIISLYVMFALLVLLSLSLHNIYFFFKCKRYYKTSILWLITITIVNLILFYLQILFSIDTELISVKITYLFLITLSFILNTIYIKIEYINHTRIQPSQIIDLISFYDIKKTMEIIENQIKNIGLSDIKQVLSDLPRNGITNYVNNGTLTDEFFEKVYKSLDEKYIYIVISNTGSPASNIISKFTKKKYNHVSLSFESELKTTLSYNGGEKILPPGLNEEELRFFNKKDDASILVYRLSVTKEQKTKIIETIKEINEQGSAYNILGLVFQTSLKPNIMFCSQFVYKMLLSANINYFEKKPEAVKPSDFVELDYLRKLEFCYELYLNDRLKK